MKRMSRSIFSIGATVFSAGTNGYALADIDEVRLWNIARSITDIRDFMCKKTTKTNNSKLKQKKNTNKTNQNTTNTKQTGKT